MVFAAVGDIHGTTKRQDGQRPAQAFCYCWPLRVVAKLVAYSFGRVVQGPRQIFGCETENARAAAKTVEARRHAHAAASKIKLIAAVDDVAVRIQVQLNELGNAVGNQIVGVHRHQITAAAPAQLGRDHAALDVLVAHLLIEGGGDFLVRHQEGDAGIARAFHLGHVVAGDDHVYIARALIQHRTQCALKEGRNPAPIAGSRAGAQRAAEKEQHGHMAKASPQIRQTNVIYTPCQLTPAPGAATSSLSCQRHAVPAF